MEMKDQGFIDGINLALIALTMNTIHHCLLARPTGEFMVPTEIGPGGGAQSRCDTRITDDALTNACTDVFRRLEADFHSSPPGDQPRYVNNIRRMVR